VEVIDGQKDVGTTDDLGVKGWVQEEREMRRE